MAWQALVNSSETEARTKTLDACRKNDFLRSIGFYETDEVLVQDLCNGFIIRSRALCGHESAPVLQVELEPRGKQTLVTAQLRMEPQSLLLSKIAFMTLGLLLLISSYAMFSVPSLGDGYAVFALSSILSGLLLLRYRSAESRILDAGLRFLNLSLSTRFYKVASGEIRLNKACQPLADNLLPLRIDMTSNVSLLLQKLAEHSQQSKQESTTFSIVRSRGALFIHRKRAANLLRLGRLDMDLAPRLKISPAGRTADATGVEVTSVASPFRKVWTAFFYALILPTGAVAIPILLLLLLIILLDPTRILPFSIAVLTYLGLIWSELALRISDETDVENLLAFLGNRLQSHSDFTSLKENDSKLKPIKAELAEQGIDHSDGDWVSTTKEFEQVAEQ